MRARVPLGAASLLVAVALAGPAGSGGASAAPGTLESRLAQVAALAEGDAAAALRAARERGLATAGGRVRVVLEGSGASGELAVRAAGGEVAQRSGGLVEALVAPHELERLAAHPGVSLVRAPYAAVPAVVGQGVAKLNATAWHAAGTPGFKGAGVKVAVIDVGFAGLAGAKSAGELPAGAELVNRCGSKLESTPHGVGVAEIVYEMAPAAELVLVCVSTELDLAQALADAKARGVQVIVHSVLWLNTSRGDGSGGPGTPDAIAAEARASGILWVNAAGNQAQKHWSGPFADANADGVHEFAGTDTTNGIGTPSSGEVCAYLKWDEWPVTDEDYDLELVLPDGTVFASSSFPQNGDDRPTEAVCAQGGGNALAVRIRRAAGSGSPRLDLFWIAPGQLEHQVAAGSLAEPATSPQVLAVGAVCVGTEALQPYSSRGPTIGGRTKPDLVSYDAVSNFSYGTSTGCTSGFVGTSAAAPHVGGAAALVLEERPGLTPAELQAVLEGKTIDLAPAGPDNDSGRGRLRLAVDLPAPVIAPAQGVEQTAAVAAATISPRIARTTYRFEYGSTTAYGTATPETAATGTSATALLGGLLPETAYRYRIVATNPFGTTQAAGGAFTTLAYRPPTAATGGAGEIGPTSATLTATVNPNGKATTVVFELGPTAGYGSTTGAVSLAAGNASIPVSVAVDGLSPASTYHFRVVATNELGQAQGGDQTLSTAPPPPAPGGGGGGGAGGAPPDLELTASADRSTVRVGDTVLVRLRVRLANPGASSGASEALLDAVLPAGAELVSAKANRGPGCTAAATVVCPLSFLSGSVVGEVELLLRLVREGAASLTATVRSPEQDASPGDNTVAVAVSALAAAAARTGASPGSAAEPPPRILLRRLSPARAPAAVVRGRLATVRAAVALEGAARLRLRVVDLRTKRALRLAPGSRLGPARLGRGAGSLELRIRRGGPLTVVAALPRRTLTAGRRYALELVAVTASGRTARLRVPFRT